MNKQIAIKIMLWLVGAIMLFHMCIVLKVIPYDIAWGGRLENDNQMYVFEGISIFINLILFITLLIKGALLRPFIPMKIVNIILWLFVAIFVLNTVGNILAQTNFEKSFAILTLAFSILIFVILRSDRKKISS